MMSGTFSYTCGTLQDDPIGVTGLRTVAIVHGRARILSDS